ncbi:hypothetical protein FRB95_014050 [Tulasnella sp. JGI-2019a]|nr:hypothetical protein FRB95_014050 [Tulasnella sp. JGI-2019a]
MAEIYPHIEVALSQADREHQEALSTLTALQTQLSLNQTKIQALVAELQATHQQAEHYARTIPQVERVRLRTDQKLRQLKEHADRVSKDLAAERRVQSYLEELQADDEHGEKRLKEYVSEVMRKDAEGYGDSDSESEWSVLDRSVGSLKGALPAPMTSGASTPVHGQRRRRGSSMVVSSRTSSRQPSPSPLSPRNNLAVSSPSVGGTSESLEGTSSASWTSGGGATTTTTTSNVSESVPELAQPPLPEVSRPTTPQHQNDQPEEPARIYPDNKEQGQEAPREIEKAYPPLSPVKRLQERHEQQMQAHSHSTPRAETSGLAGNVPDCSDVPEEMCAVDDGYDGEEEAGEVEEKESVMHSPNKYMTPSTQTLDSINSPASLTTEPQAPVAAYDEPSQAYQNEHRAPSPPSTSAPNVVEAQDSLGLHHGYQQHAAQVSSPPRSPPSSCPFPSPRRHYYPPTSARSALIAMQNSPAMTSMDGHESHNSDLPSPPAQQNQKYVWSPLPPNGARMEPGLISPSSYRHRNADQPQSGMMDRRAETSEADMAQILSYREYIPARSPPNSYDRQSPSPIDSRRQMVRPALS